MMGTAHLRIEVEGATPGEIQRGLETAQKVFDDAGTTAFHAAWDYWLRDQWEFGIDLPCGEIVDLWTEAADAALTACCQGWATVPTSAYLGLTDAYRDEMMRLHPETMDSYLEAARRRGVGL